MAQTARPAGGAAAHARAPDGGEKKRSRTVPAWTQIVENSWFVVVLYALLCLCVSGLLLHENGVYLLFLPHPPALVGFDAERGVFAAFLLATRHPVFWCSLLLQSLILLAMINRDLKVQDRAESRVASRHVATWIACLAPLAAMYGALELWIPNVAFSAGDRALLAVLAALGLSASYVLEGCRPWRAVKREMPPRAHVSGVLARGVVAALVGVFGLALVVGVAFLWMTKVRVGHLATPEGAYAFVVAAAFGASAVTTALWKMLSALVALGLERCFATVDPSAWRWRVVQLAHRLLRRFPHSVLYAAVWLGLAALTSTLPLLDTRLALLQLAIQLALIVLAFSVFPPLVRFGLVIAVWIGVGYARSSSPVRYPIPWDAPTLRMAEAPDASGAIAPLNWAAAAPLRPVTLGESLTGWRAERLARREDPGTLYVLALSGGGYRATLWSAVVIDAVFREHGERFRGKVRLITGSSGGVIAGAYFYALSGAGCPVMIEAALRADLAASDPLQDPRADPNHPCSAEDALAQTAFLERFEAERGAPVDSMGVVLNALSRDVWDLARAEVIDWERGRALERQWRTLAQRLGDHAELERAGRLASIIFTPTLLDTGQPIVISNLYWSDDSRAAAPAAGSACAEDPPQPLFLFSFKPDGAQRLNIATAARLSATFPIILPTIDVDLECGDKPFQIGDAGYYDNYGVETALDVLSSEDAYRFIINPDTAIRRIVLIELRAFPENDAFGDNLPVQADPDHARRCHGGSLGDADLSWVMRQFDVLEGPLRGFGAAARRLTEIRLSRRVDALERLVSTQEDGFEIVRIQLVNSADVSFSWAIGDDEIDCLRDEIVKVKENACAFEMLGAYLNEDVPYGAEWAPSAECAGMRAPPPP